MVFAENFLFLTGNHIFVINWQIDDKLVFVIVISDLDLLEDCSKAIFITIVMLCSACLKTFQTSVMEIDAKTVNNI